jgi:hypothetical protein
MTLVMIGALLVFAGVMFMAAQPLWQGRLSSVKRPDERLGQGLASQEASDTLEPRKPARGLGIKWNWPGLAMVAAGAVLLLVGATF